MPGNGSLACMAAVACPSGLLTSWLHLHLPSSPPLGLVEEHLPVAENTVMTSLFPSTSKPFCCTMCARTMARRPCSSRVGCAAEAAA